MCETNPYINTLFATFDQHFQTFWLLMMDCLGDIEESINLTLDFAMYWM